MWGGKAEPADAPAAISTCCTMPESLFSLFFSWKESKNVSLMCIRNVKEKILNVERGGGSASSAVLGQAALPAQPGH